MMDGGKHMMPGMPPKMPMMDKSMGRPAKKRSTARSKKRDMTRKPARGYGR